MTGLLTNLLAALSWDPQIRGSVIVITAVVILCGSVYLLLMTNTGARLGLLLAAAGLFGWMALMGWIWVVYGIGLRGEAPHWKVLEVVTGDDLARLTTLDAINPDFPEGWSKLPAGDPSLGEAQAAADHVLVEGAAAAADHGEGAAEPDPALTRFGGVYESLDDYVYVAAYRRGGEDYYIPGGYLERSEGFLKGWFHKPHYAVVRTQPVIEQPDLGAAPAAPTPDPDAEPAYVVMVRDLGNLRFPSFMFGLFNTVLFGVACYALHRRDKQLMAARAAAPAPAS